MCDSMCSVSMHACNRNERKHEGEEAISPPQLHSVALLVRAVMRERRHTLKAR